MPQNNSPAPSTSPQGPLRILMVGASGFLSRVLVRESLRQKHVVAVCGRSDVGHEGVGHLDWTCDPQALSEGIKSFSPDCVVHCAGSASVAESFVDPYADFQASVGTWVHTLEAVRLSGLRPLLLYPSSAAVYGNPTSLPISEDMELRPISPYGRHKVICEQLSDQYACDFGLRIITLRLFSVFGPAQRRLLIWELFRKLTETHDVLEVAGTGMESRDFLNEWDVAAVILSLASHPPEAGCPSVFNLASGEMHSVLEVAGMLRDQIAPDKEIVCLGQARPGDPLCWKADVHRLRSVLPQWEPAKLADALQRTVAAWIASE